LISRLEPCFSAVDTDQILDFTAGTVFFDFQYGSYDQFYEKYPCRQEKNTAEKPFPDFPAVHRRKKHGCFSQFAQDNRTCPVWP
jgi:hypothetical protein